MMAHEEEAKFPSIDVRVFSNPNRWQDPPDHSISKPEPSNDTLSLRRNRGQIPSIAKATATRGPSKLSHIHRAFSHANPQSLASTQAIPSSVIQANSVRRIAPVLEDLELLLSYNRRKKLDLGSLEDVASHEPIIACQCDGGATNEALVKLSLPKSFAFG